MSALKLESVSFDFCLATDLKLQNIMIGIQSGSAKFPCAYCESERPFNVIGALRTLGRIRALYKSFDEDGASKKDGQDYLNVIHDPLLDGDDDVFILDLLPIPELHLHIGIGKMNLLR